MSKKLKNLNWESVALEGFPASVTNSLQGFVGLEECTDYGFEKDTKKPTKKKQNSKKRKNPIENNATNNITNKKVKLENGFIIESCDNVTPSVTSEFKENNINIQNRSDKNKPENNKKKEITNVQLTKKLNKPKLGEDIGVTKSDLTPEDMLTWAEFKLPESIIKSLMELGFKKPTKIQQLTLPAAIHGRRDILGAAETGSGKTLAFGLPILSGILKLKEKAELKNLDVYDIPYKKSSVKKKNNEQIELRKGNNDKKKKHILKNSKLKNDIEIPSKVQAKESSEDGYSSADESTDHSDDNNKVNPGKNSKEDSVLDDEEYLEEIEVPLRKKPVSADEGNDSDDSENYIHLSDMLDSDDLVESDEAGDSGSDNRDKDEIQELPGSDNKSDSDENDDTESKPDEELEKSDIANNKDGIGLVKVLDDVEIPGHAIVKTGKPLYALIVTPTRELAIQISRHLIAAAKYTGIKIATIVGGMAAVKQERVLRHGPEVVVATPGRLWELVNQGQPHLQQLASVKFLAIDETDRMVERGHFEELHPLLERLNTDEERRSTRQNFVFSATLTLVHDLPMHMKGKKVTKRGKIINRKIEKMTPRQKVDKLIKMIGMTDPKVVDITTSLGTAETLTECRITCSLEHKDAYLYYILKRHPGRTIVFCNSIGNVKRLAQLLTLLKCNPLPLHANMQQRQRLKNLERFRDDAHGALISTDVAARGLDIPNVDHVVHYQVPRTAENYVHRSGRTARASKEGLTILMMEPSEAYLYSKLCRTLNKTSELETFPVASQSLTPLIELVQVARDLDALHTKQRRAAQAVGWREKAAREMDIIVDDDDLPVKKVDPAIEKAIRAKKRQLDGMLTRPIYPRGFSFKYPTLNDPAALNIPEEKALEVMKKAIESGELKKQKRNSKNAPLLKLEKIIKAKNGNKYRKKK